MTEQSGSTTNPAGDAVAGDDPSVNRDAPPAGETDQPATPPDQATTAAPSTSPETEPAGETDGEATGIEPGETQSVPTTRGPGPDGDPVQGQ